MHHDEQLIRARYELLASRDFEGLRRQLADDVVWHVPGRNPHSGDHRGVEAVLTAMRHVVELSEGTSTINLRAVLADDTYVAAVECGSARRGAASVEALNISLFLVTEGQIAEMWFVPSDQYAIDRFWADATTT